MKVQTVKTEKKKTKKEGNLLEFHIITTPENCRRNKQK
jgi:hypothetical protein